MIERSAAQTNKTRRSDRSMVSKITHDLSSSQIEEIVRVLYQGFLGRDPDPNGMQFWTGKIQAGESALAVLAGFLLSQEGKAKRALGKKTGELSRKLGEAIDGTASAEPIVVVDVGAQTLAGEDHVYSPLLAHAKGRVIGFEPLEHRRRERELAEKSIDLSMRATFIGDGRSHTFHINNFDATSSLLPVNRDIVDDLADYRTLETKATETVATTTLDEAISDVSRVDFLKLDIQGFEYPALVNSASVLSRTLVVHCEVEFLPLYRGQALFSDIDQLLRKSEFRFADFSRLSRSSFKSGPVASRDQLSWADAVYFKEVDTITEPICLLIQAFIAVAIYGKLSLARFLVEEYDRKVGTSFESLFDD
jgi:FkbM family methyltransferase